MGTAQGTVVHRTSVGVPSSAPHPRSHLTVAPPSPLRVGNYLSTALAPFYQGVTDYLAGRLGRPATLVNGSALGAFAAGDVDVGFL